MPRTLGYIDQVAHVDRDGEAHVLQAAGGLTFRFADPSNPDAGTICKLAVRSGGMIVAEETRGGGALSGANATLGASAQTTPLSEEAREAIAAAAERPGAPVRPGQPRRAPARVG